MLYKYQFGGVTLNHLQSADLLLQLFTPGHVCAAVQGPLCFSQVDSILSVTKTSGPGVELPECTSSCSTLGSYLNSLRFLTLDGVIIVLPNFKRFLSHTVISIKTLSKCLEHCKYSIKVASCCHLFCVFLSVERS